MSPIIPSCCPLLMCSAPTESPPHNSKTLVHGPKFGSGPWAGYNAVAQLERLELRSIYPCEGSAWACGMLVTLPWTMRHEFGYLLKMARQGNPQAMSELGMYNQQGINLQQQVTSRLCKASMGMVLLSPQGTSKGGTGRGPVSH